MVFTILYSCSVDVFVYRRARQYHTVFMFSWCLYIDEQGNTILYSWVQYGIALLIYIQRNQLNMNTVWYCLARLYAKTPTEHE
jgi:hypothetical protein